jgi:putative hemolysin
LEPPSLEVLSILPNILLAQYALPLQIALILVLLVVSALVSGSEVAFFSLTPTDVEDLNGSKSRSSSRVLGLLENPNKLLATILIVNNLVNVAIILCSTYVVNTLMSGMDPGMVVFIQIVAVTFIILLLGEVIPKVYANRHALKLARGMSGTLIILRSMFSWLSVLLVSGTSVIEKRIPQREANISVDELEHALELTSDKETDEEEHKILKGIVRFGSTDVKQVMTPRTDVIAFDLNTPYTSLIAQIIDSGYSRIPIYQDSFDKVFGILYIKDLLAHMDAGDDMKWQDLIRNPYFVPENKKIDDLLQEFRQKKTHVAVVVDEYGGTSGVVSLEDILEEIVGEITDEFDDDDLEYSKLDDHNYVFEGKTPLNDIYRVLDIDGKMFEEVKGEADTLAGFILELSGKIPVKNEKTTFEHYVFTIEAADVRRVKRVKLTIKEPIEINGEKGKDEA